MRPKMVRDDLCITVPSFFRCPISLDVMKSPVSLCTGVTYDRSSIQRWLDGGNNTCPATMQVLQTKDIVPNRTLERLIRIWSGDGSRASADSPESYSESDCRLSKESIIVLVQMIITSANHSDGEISFFLAKILRFANESADNREFLANIEGLESFLVDFLGHVNDHSRESFDAMGLAVRVLEIALKRSDDRENLTLKSTDCLNSIVRVMQRGNHDSKIASVKIIESIAINAESKLLIAEKEGLLLQLENLISPDTDSALLEPVLSCLISLSMLKRVKITLANQDTIKSLSTILSPSSNPNASLIEKVLKLLETVSSCKEGRNILCSEPSCMELILNRAFKVSSLATERSVTVLWSACCIFSDERAKEGVRRENGLAKILLLMQSNCSPNVKAMCGDLIRVLSVHSRSCLTSYDTKTAHIMPF